MEVKKTHIFIKYNSYSGMGASKFQVREVHECRIPTESLSDCNTSMYFIKEGNSLRIIDTKELHKLQNDTEEALKHL